MARRKLIWHFFPLLVVVTIGTLLAVSINASTMLRSFHFSETSTDLKARAELIRLNLDRSLADYDPTELQALCRQLGEPSNTRITLILANGTVVADSDEANLNAMENHAGRPEVKAALAGKVGTDIRRSSTLSQEMSYTAIPLMADGAVSGVVRTAVPLTSIYSTLNDLYIRIAIGSAIIGFIATIALLLVSRRVTSPLENMRSQAERFTGGDFEARLPVPDSEEMGALAKAVNRMASQLQDRIEAVEHERNEREAILASMVEGVFAIGTDGRLFSLNTAAAAMLDIDPDQAEGRSIYETLRNADLQRFVAQTIESADTISAEITLTQAGNELMANVHGTSLNDAQGRRLGALFVLHDITRVRRLENARRDFVANVTHELKTPITSIKGYVETLLDGASDDPEANRRFLKIIGRQADRFDLLIEDLLTLSRLEQEDESDTIVRHQLRITDVIEAAVQDCEQTAKEQGVEVVVNSAERPSVMANAPLLQVAVRNLIDNAIKYSDPGAKVTVDAIRNGDGVEVHVHDTGCGIEKEHLPRLFERFYRIDKARSRKLGGTGLGLAIVKHIVRVHHGQTGVDSTPNQGSTFSIYLPAD